VSNDVLQLFFDLLDFRAHLRHALHGNSTKLDELALHFGEAFHNGTHLFSHQLPLARHELPALLLNLLQLALPDGQLPDHAARVLIPAFGEGARQGGLLLSSGPFWALRADRRVHLHRAAGAGGNPGRLFTPR